jgi:ribonucleotide reductase beta subunit family protein with ferritin-like domain
MSIFYTTKDEKDEGCINLLFPLDPHYQELYKHYQLHRDAFWTPEEVKLETDKRAFMLLPEPDRKHLLEVLAFFAGSDIVVVRNLTFLLELVKNPIARIHWENQIDRENVHSIQYGNLIMEYVSDETERDQLLRGVESKPHIQRKKQLADKWINKTDDPILLMVCFYCMEAIMFSSSFACILRLKQKKKGMDGLFHANKLIMKDEGMHAEGFAIILTQYETMPHHSVVNEIIKEWSEEEQRFVEDTICEPIMGLQKEDMKQYVQYVTDKASQRLGCPSIYGVTNPFSWMDLQGICSKENFFERPTHNYSKISGESTTVACREGFSF